MSLSFLRHIDPFQSNRPYIKKQYHERIVNHRPKSTCDSLYYEYVQSPACDFIVSKLPGWLAPNLITVWGFCWILSCLVITLILYGNSTEGDYSRELAFYCGVAYFIYTTADNCDGKQARKNKTGSVMGMLFDHGLDATTAILMNVVIARIVQVGNGLPAILAIQISTVPFYYLTMEEYYIGMLNLPMFTGPDDTSLLISGLCFMSAYTGPEWWSEQLEIPFGIHEIFGLEPTLKRSSYAVFLIYYVEVTFVILGSLNKYWKARDESHFKERFTLQSFVLHGGYMVMNLLVYDIYGMLCGSDILYTHARSIVFCFAGQYLQAVLRMIVANASGENFNPYRRTTLIAWGLMGVNIVSFLFTKEALIDEKWLFRGINIMIWSAIAHFTFHVLSELKVILNMNMFTVKPLVANPQEDSSGPAQSPEAKNSTNKNNAKKTK